MVLVLSGIGRFQAAEKVTPFFSTICPISHSKITVSMPCTHPLPPLLLSFSGQVSLNTASALHFGQLRPRKAASHARFRGFHSLNARV
jgi:hypothetical protein